MPMITPTKKKSNVASKWDAVAHVREELTEIKPRYELIRDCLKGEYAVKAKKTKYLPKPNAADTSDKNEARYKEYLTRAVFYNVTERTSEGLVGQIFLRNPMHKLPPLLEPLVKNADGEGLTLTQVAKQACGHILPYGRGGILADFPNLDKQPSKKELDEGTVRPVIKFYSPFDIINWQTEVVNSETVLTMVVLKEYYEKREPNSFKVTKYEQYRVLELVDGCTRVTIVKFGDRGDEPATEKYELCDHEEKPFDRLPFVFCGSENNDAKVDCPPLYNMAILNLGHFRNSADYEESCFFIGQPTLFLSGLTDQWVKDVLKDKVQMGSRGGIPGPPGSRADLLQVTPNSIAFEAMKHKEEQMVAIGAKLVERKSGVERKEKEIEIEAASDVSILTKIAMNIEEAFVKALEFCARFVGADAEGIEYEVNKIFDLTSYTPEEVRQLKEIFESETPALLLEEMRGVLERMGITKYEFAEFEIKLEEQQTKRMDMIKKMTEATAPPVPPGGTGDPNEGGNNNQPGQ